MLTATLVRTNPSATPTMYGVLTAWWELTQPSLILTHPNPNQPNPTLTLQP